MIFSCRYDSSGKISEWSRGSNLSAHKSAEQATGSGTFALVSSYPKEVLEHPEQWALTNLRIKCVNSNGTVEVELG